MIETSMMTDPAPGYLSTIIGIFEKDNIKVLSTQPLTGDASDRRYIRVHYLKREYRCSLIVMKLAQTQKNELPFINVHSFLQDKNIPVPKIFFYDDQRGYLFLEDCGDTTLEDKIRNLSDQEQKTLYMKAIDIVLAMQQSGVNSQQCIAHSLFFDPEKLMWELDFMLKHMVKGLLKKEIPKTDLSVIEKGFYNICLDLQKEPRTFTHRDYHSRNIMVKEGNLFIIDFQDARMGPCQYDLASLLKDSYTNFSEPFASDLLDYYLQKREELGCRLCKETFLKNYDLMSIQRNLKAIGTFAFQKVEKKNDRYEKYIRPTLSMIESNLQKHEEFDELHTVLAQYLPFQE